MYKFYQKDVKRKKRKNYKYNFYCRPHWKFRTANYAASKADSCLFKSLSEYAKKNINVNCVSPGFIKTEMTDKISEDFKKLNEANSVW